MELNFSSTVVFITGATGQLGHDLCRAFLDAGATVVATDVSLNQEKMLTGDAIEYHEMDVTNRKQVTQVFEDVVSRHKKIDVLINNAGVSCFEPFEERPEKSVDWVMDVNLKGTFFCIQEYVNLFDTHQFKSGVIVNIASMYGVISPDPRIYTDCPRKNSEIYGATKAGIIQMTRYFAAHLASRNIRANAVSPGGILNPENPQGEDFQKEYALRCPMKRMAETSEVTNGVLFLSSDEASYVNGHNLVIDGGMSCW